MAGHVSRINQKRLPKQKMEGCPDGKRGRPRLRWLDDVETDLKSLGVRPWRGVPGKK